MTPNSNDLQARLRELDRLKRAHIRGLQLACREIKQVVAAAVEAGIRLEVPARPGRRRDGR